MTFICRTLGPSWMEGFGGNDNGESLASLYLDQWNVFLKLIKLG